LMSGTESGDAGIQAMGSDVHLGELVACRDGKSVICAYPETLGERIADEQYGMCTVRWCGAAGSEARRVKCVLHTVADQHPAQPTRKKIVRNSTVQTELGRSIEDVKKDLGSRQPGKNAARDQEECGCA